jgi:hypothetical protein
MDVRRLRIVDCGVVLCREENALVAFQGSLKRIYRGFPPITKGTIM